MSGKDYVSLSVSAPEFGAKTLYANLGRAAGQSDPTSTPSSGARRLSGRPLPSPSRRQRRGGSSRLMIRRQPPPTHPPGFALRARQPVGVVGRAILQARRWRAGRRQRFMEGERALIVLPPPTAAASPT